MSRFQIGSSTSQSPDSTPARYASSNADSDYDDDDLPYPAELPRNDFLKEDFDPQIYLSTLRNRHQTLEDLRSDLRARSQLLNKELLDLVNGNYEEFLSLGGDLKGGEEKVEGVRVGLLGFEREVEGIKKVVNERMEEVGRLLEEKKGLRRDIVVGRGLLEVEEELKELEAGLGIRERDGEDLDLELDEDEDDEVVEDGIVPSIAMKKLQRHTQQYILITRLIARLGPEHAFLQIQRPRLEEVRRTLLLDLAATLRQAKAVKAHDAILQVMKLYADLDAENEGAEAARSGG